MTADPVNPTFETVHALYEADFYSAVTGMSGSRTEFYYRAIDANSVGKNTLPVWLNFLDSAKRTRQVAIAARMLAQIADAQQDASLKMIAWLTLGHYLRFTAHDHAESAKCYLKAYTGGPGDAVSAALAIIRLWRADPQCGSAREALAALRRRRDFPAVSMDEAKARYESLPPENNDERCRALIDLAVAAIIEWGDASLALTVLDSAAAISPAAQGLTDIYGAILLAVPDNASIIDQAVAFLISQNAWTPLERFDAEMERLPFKPSADTLLGLSMMYALRQSNPAKAAYLLTLCALLYPSDLKSAIENQAWICLYATENDSFRFALCDCLRHINDDALSASVLSHLERFLKVPSLRIQARLQHVRCISKNDPDAAIAAIQPAIREAADDNAFAIYDALLYIQSAFVSPDQAKLFDLASSLHDHTAGSELFALFLNRFEPRLSVIDDELNKKIAQKRAILNALFCRDRSDANASGDILAACMTLLENGDKTACMNTFFHWCSNHASFKTALPVLDAIDARLAKHERLTPGQLSATLLKPGKFPTDTSSYVLALALILEADNAAWLDELKQIKPNWVIVVRTVLRYLSHCTYSDALLNLISNEIRRSLELFHDTLLDSMEVCMDFDVLFEQVMQMADSHDKQPEVLEKIDETIDNFKGSTAQKNALYMKKYEMAEQMGNERVQLETLKSILENTPGHPQALEKFHAVKPETLKPHSLILYYQIDILLDNTPQTRLINQMALASLYTQTSQFNNAVALYHTIIDENPTYGEARKALFNLLKSLENWKSAENALLSLVNTTRDAAVKYDALVELAEIQADHMFVPSRALLTLFDAVDTMPEKMNELHATLCKISEQIHAFSPLLDKYEDMATHAADYSIRRTATILLAQVYANYLQKPALACNVMDEFYQRGGTQDPEFLEIFASFYADIQDWENYALILNDLLALYPDNPEKKAVIALALAHAYGVQLADPAKAGFYAHIAADSNPDSSQSWLEIADFYINSEPPENAIAPLYKAASLEPDDDQKGKILIEIAKLCAELERLKDAAEALHHAVRYTSDLPVITPIAESLIALSTKLQNKAIFNQLCKDLIGCCPGYEQISLLLEQALTLVKVFDDKEEAHRILDSHTAQFSALDVEQSIILAQLLRLLGEHQSSIHIIEGIFNNFSLEDDDRFQCLRELLENATALNDSQLIQNTAEKLLEISPDDSDATFQLAQLDYRAGRWDQAYAKIQALLAHPELLSAKNAMFMHYYYAEILHAAEHDDLAIESLNNATRIQGNFRQAVDLKLALLLENQRWQEALPVFDDLLRLTDDDEVRGAIHKRIGELYHFYLNDPQKAIDEYELAITLGGDVEDVPIRLLQLYQDLKLWQKAAMTAHVLAMAQVSSPDARTAYLTVLGDIQCNHLDEGSNAVNTYLEAFSITPSNPLTVAHLSSLLIEKQDWDNIQGMFGHLISKLAPGDDDTAKSLAWMAWRVQNFTVCNDLQEKARQSLQNAGFDIQELEALALKEFPQVEIESLSRKRVHTSPQGSLTIDSSLLKNPEIKHANPETHQSMMTDALPKSDPKSDSDDDLFPPKTQDATVEKSSTPLQLPDDALLPIDDQTQRSSDATDAPPVHTSNFFPTIISRTSSKRNIMRAFETLDFTIDDIRTLADEAPLITRRAIDGLLDIAVVPHDNHESKPLPASISDIVLQALCTTSTSTNPPGISKLLTALVSSENSPALTPLPQTDATEIPLPDDFSKVFQHLRQILKRPHTELLPHALDSMTNAPVLNTFPAAILYAPIQLQNMTVEQWTTHIIYALVLSRPENLLCAALPPDEVLAHLNNATLAFGAVRAKSADIPQQLREQYKSLLQKAGISSAMIPRINQDSLAVIQQHAQTGRKNAIQAAYILTQNLIDCLQILTETENLRFPSTLSSLKSAMKYSPIVKDFILFAIGSNAQRLFDRVFK